LFALLLSSVEVRVVLQLDSKRFRDWNPSILGAIWPTCQHSYGFQAFDRREQILENTLEKGFETFHLYDIPFTLPGTSNHEAFGARWRTFPPGGYRLYKSRFVGLVALVSFLKFCSVSDSEFFVVEVILGIVAGMSGPWFGPIANNGNFISNQHNPLTL
jgi:hypothetical protein